MTQPDNHRIQRQVIELEFAAGMPGLESQELLAREVREQVIPALSAAFDEAAGPNDWLRLDRLALDLGTISADDWAPRLRERLIEQIRRELARHAPQRRRDAPALRERAPSTRPMQQFLFFLAHGRLPWWGERPAGGFGAEFASGRVVLEWDALRATLRADARARERLVDVLDDAQLEAGVARWGGVPHAARVLAAWAAPATTPSATPAWRRRFWLALVEWALEDGLPAGRGAELVQALRRAWRAVAEPQGAASAPLPSHVETPGGSPAAASQAVSWPAPWNEWLAAAPEEAAGADALPTTRAASTASPRALPTKPLHVVAVRKPAAESEDEAIYLPGAGVVLLHPFLETLFRERGLLEGSGFRDEPARAHAVRLVGLLGFGDADVPEYDLLIAKQLCGHPLELPLAPGVLDAADGVACDALLAAVLGHWSALRSSSAHWLRTQFFLRDGKLESVDFGCRLTIERRAQDVLLLRLPWGFGVIGLPWMKERIFVRWLD